MDELISGYGVELRTLTGDKLEKVRTWRNHKEVSRFMVNREPISKQQQQAWFEKISRSATCAHYLICFRDQEIGLIYIHSTDDLPLSQSHVIEPGMYLAFDSPYRGTILAFCPALAMNDYCFEQLQCRKMIARVQLENKAALRFNQQLGYRRALEEGDFAQLELDWADYRKAREALSRFIRF